MDDKQVMEWFEEFIGGAHHTRIFLTSRNKMHPDGVNLWDMSVASAKGILANLRERAARAKAVLKVVNEQAEDDGLWFIPQTVTEDYLQHALRRLHVAIEGKTETECAIAALSRS